MLSIREDFENERNLSYSELTEHVREKYGDVPYSYFRTETCKSKNTKNSRTKEGLEIHHLGEDKYPNLTNPDFARMSPWSEQQPDRLVYCNLLEHALFHVLISEQINANPKYKGPSYQPFFDFTSDFVNDILLDHEFKRQWMRTIADQMKDNKDLLVEMYTRVGAESLLSPLK